MTHRVSVVVPCHNCAPTIAQCIESLTAQTPEIAEIIVLDDGSQDQSSDIAQTFKVTLHRFTQSVGLGALRRYGLLSARESLVAFLNGDCFANPDWLENLLVYMDERDVAMVGGKLIEVRDTTFAERWRRVNLRQDWGNQVLVNPDYLSGSNLLVRKDHVLGIGNYNPRYDLAYEDVDISRRLRVAGYKLVYTPQATVLHYHPLTVANLLQKLWTYSFYSTSKRMPTSWLNVCFNIYKTFARRSDYLRKSFVSDFHNRRLSFLAFDCLAMIYHILIYLRCKKFLAQSKKSSCNLREFFNGSAE